MGNFIEVAVMNSIIALYERGWSKRRIARELGLDRETVRRHVRIWAGGHSKPAIPTAGNSLPEGSKPAIPTAGDSGRKSQCEPFRGLIEEKTVAGLSAQRIYQDLRLESGFAGAYESVKRFVRKLLQAHPRPIYRLESPPGEEAQVDFGSGAPIRDPDGRLQKTHVFRVTLSFSRKSYSECVLRQTTESFIRCLENSFRDFGGVPRFVCLDNLKAAVVQADWYDPVLNPKIEEFARHYGTVFMPTRPYSPRHKGKIESGIKYVKNNAMKGKVFASVAEENAYLKHWEETVADCRIHGTTRKQVGRLFVEAEKAALIPLPAMIFPCFEEGQRTVHKDSYVEVARSYYHVPPEYIGRKVWVRWDARLVRIYNQRFEQITVLARLSPGRFSECLSTGGRWSSVEKDLTYWIGRASLLGDKSGEWATAVGELRGPPAIRVIQGLISLTRNHSHAHVEKACALAISHGAWRLRDVRRLMKAPIEQGTFGFLDNHPLIREMSEYSAFLKKLAPSAPAEGERKEAVKA